MYVPPQVRGQKSLEANPAFPKQPNPLTERTKGLKGM